MSTIRVVTMAMTIVLVWSTRSRSFKRSTPAMTYTDAVPITVRDQLPYMQLTLPRSRLILVDAIEPLSEMLRFVDEAFPVDQQYRSGPMCIGFDCEWEPERYWKIRQDKLPTADSGTVISTGEDTRQRISKPILPIPNNPVLLLQIAFGDMIYVLDMQVLCRQLDIGRRFTLLASTLSPTENLVDQIFLRLFHRHDIIKVGLGPQPDLKRLYWSYPWLPSLSKVLAVADIQSLAKKRHPTMNKRDLEGLSKLCQLELGIAIDKSQQCSHWERRPLTEEQLLYAGLDAWSLTCLFDSFCRNLQANSEEMPVIDPSTITTKSKKKHKGRPALSDVVRSVTKDYRLLLPQPLEDGVGDDNQPVASPLPSLGLRAVIMEETPVPKHWLFILNEQRRG